MQIVRRKQPAVAVQLVHRRRERRLPWKHLGLLRRPFLRLHGEQAATTFSQVVWPPLLRGMMWSKVRSSFAVQYWQAKRSRRKTLNRVKAGCVLGLTNDFNETTLGS